jgi:hypothetical protein
MRKTAAAKKGKSPASSSGGDSKTKTTAKSSRLPLESVHCCVETFNSDGVDSSNGFIQILKVKPLFCYHSHSSQLQELVHKLKLVGFGQD